MSIYGGPDIITDGLVLDMDFGSSKCYSGTGTACTDISNSNLTGELGVAAANLFAPTFNTSVNNKFFSFNGETNARLIRIPNSTILDTQTPSVEVWIKTNATNQYGFWFEKGVVNSQYSLFQHSTVIYWRQTTSVGGLLDLITDTSSTAGLNTTNWFQITGTYVSGSRKLYVNGILKNSDSATGTLATNAGGMSIGVFGGYSGSRGYYYNGDIAIVRVYNKELSASEVLTNYNSLKGRFGL
jgi:hypothetical protein